MAETKWSEYTLADFRAFYPKICAQLASGESKLLYKLVKSSEKSLVSHSNLIGLLGDGFHPDLARPFEKKEVETAKKNYLRKLLCGASLDYLEAVSDEFQLIRANPREVEDGNFMLLLSDKEESLGALLSTMGKYGNEKTGYACFVSHSVDGDDYALVGRKK